jgi:hypothetical protein
VFVGDKKKSGAHCEEPPMCLVVLIRRPHKGPCLPVERAAVLEVVGLVAAPRPEPRYDEHGRRAVACVARQATSLRFFVGEELRLKV